VVVTVAAQPGTAQSTIAKIREKRAVFLMLQAFCSMCLAIYFIIIGLQPAQLQCSFFMPCSSSVDGLRVPP